MHDSTTTVAELIKLVGDFVAERQWESFHDPKNLSASIAIEAAELMEHFQWLRSDQLDSVRDDAKTMAEVVEELADITAYYDSAIVAQDSDEVQPMEIGRASCRERV